jgi:hypothetical protein
MLDNMCVVNVAQITNSCKEKTNYTHCFIAAGCIAGSSSHLWPTWVPDTMSTSKLNLPHLWAVFAVAEYCGAAYKALA